MNLVSLLFLLCSVVFADYIRDLDKIAGRLAKNIPEDRTVVVFNILKDGVSETKNSIDLAIKLSLRLAEKGRKKFRVIDRAAGEKLVYEEAKYTAKPSNSEELKSLLENFKADIGILGRYSLFGRRLILENFRAVGVPSPDQAPKIFGSFERKVIKLSSEDSLSLSVNDVLLPQLPDSITEWFLSASTDNDFVSAQIVDLEEKAIGNQYVKIGEYYRLRINLKENLFLYIFSYDEDNNIAYLIHPVDREEDRYIKEGTFLIPQGNNAIEAKAPAGRNFVKIFAVKKPITFAIPQSANWQMNSGEVADFVKELKRLSTDDWSSYRIFIHISQE